ncbi:unnamed protein product [Arctia plantaginis]|uniref:Uncharacterized protein n=1 Tax=Arctia plantaginis TaxID=874455 RepID=A0A8S0Z0B7_ARCPL|nr:unnamed protein product [Arctia plantaginis]CAB3247494.1 unnamed protein product [Arctia plantaginis]
MCGYRKLGKFWEACSNIMEISILIQKNDFEDDLPTMTPLRTLVLSRVFDIEGQPDPEPQPASSKRPRTD